MTKLSDYVGATLGVNLDTTETINQVTVTNTGGTNAIILEATTLRAGVMTTAQVAKLNGLAGTNLGTSVATNSIQITSSTGNNTFIYPATNSQAGIMSREQAIKLDDAASISADQTFLGVNGFADQIFANNGMTLDVGLRITNMPTSPPPLVGSLWRDGADVKIVI